MNVRRIINTKKHVITLANLTHIETDDGQLYAQVRLNKAKRNAVTHNETIPISVDMISVHQNVVGDDVLLRGTVTINVHHRHFSINWYTSIANDYWLSKLKIHNINGKHHHLIAPKLAEIGKQAMNSYLASDDFFNDLHRIAVSN